VSESCFVIAIDGPSGAGKSTVARRVAERLRYHYLDSGALYRAIALAAIDAGVGASDETGLERLLAAVRVEVDDRGRVLLDGCDVGARIRSQEVGQVASRLSGRERVRAHLIDLQRAVARAPGMVAEGRDMGTVVFPQAALKIFLDADPVERASRRALELESRGQAAELQSVQSEMEERDRRDSSRALAPLRAATDALVIDSTSLTIEEVVAAIVKEAARRASGK
jgi:CMP/dCMP kinase